MAQAQNPDSPDAAPDAAPSPAPKSAPGAGPDTRPGAGPVPSPVADPDTTPGAGPLTAPATDHGGTDADSYSVSTTSQRSGRAPLFLHRETYRRRRVMDAARLLPFLGAALLLLPTLWADTHLTSMGAVFLFLAWLVLIVVAAVLARRLAEPLRGTARGDVDDAG